MVYFLFDTVCGAAVSTAGAAVTFTVGVFSASVPLLFGFELSLFELSCELPDFVEPEVCDEPESGLGLAVAAVVGEGDGDAAVTAAAPDNAITAITNAAKIFFDLFIFSNSLHISNPHFSESVYNVLSLAHS